MSHRVILVCFGSRTEYPTSGIPSGGNAQRLECPTLNFLLGIHDNTPRIPNDAIPNDGIPNNGMSSNYIRYNMWWVFCPCLTGMSNNGMPNDGIPNSGMSSNYIRYNM